ncbi:hypothetical protein SAMN05661096_02478 [Marivirga sericea]|uniref:Uncharacterized protein n=1 Tax=Marivirga sericea TaxID=1028 RepID=A0A1X7K9I3_9BACT|nr:hypothetical protein [Marivirga sericea]SMG37773.1 hypothetical protein SAMN05661096_02478 [Marivirga sericea]
MKTYPNILKPVKQYVLIGIIVLITLFGLTLKANAQSISLESNVEKINNAMVVQLAAYDFDMVIPKVTKEELQAIKDASFNALVYVTDKEIGYYFNTGTKWEMQNVREVFELIDINLAIQQPHAESLIIVADASNQQTLLDYNDHIKHIYRDFIFDKSDNSMAINVERK